MPEESQSSKQEGAFAKSSTVQEWVAGNPAKVCPATSDLVSYNRMLEGFLNCKAYRPILTVSNIGDGSFLLKMSLPPFPPLTCLVTEREWMKLMEEVTSSVYESDATNMGNSVSFSTDSMNNEVGVVNKSPPVTPVSKCSGSSPRSSSCYTGPEASFSRHSLKVRFHRTDVGYQYRVIDAIDGNVVYDPMENSIKPSSRKERKKKTKRHSQERQSCEESAYIIDDSALLDSDSNSVSPKFSNGHDSTDIIPNGDTCSHVETVFAQFNLEKSVNTDDTDFTALFTWPVDGEKIPKPLGENVIATDQQLVSHHTWKHKQRRGDPVRVTSYVKRQGFPVFATISLNQHGSSSHTSEDKFPSTSVPLRQECYHRRSHSCPPTSPDNHSFLNPYRRTSSCERRNSFPSQFLSSSLSLVKYSSMDGLFNSRVIEDQQDEQIFAVEKAEADMSGEVSEKHFEAPVNNGPPHLLPSDNNVTKDGESLSVKQSPGPTQERPPTRMLAEELSTTKICKTEDYHPEMNDTSVLRPEIAEDMQNSKIDVSPGDKSDVTARTHDFMSEFHMTEEYDGDMTEATVCRHRENSIDNSLTSCIEKKLGIHGDDSFKTDGQSCLRIAPVEDERLFSSKGCVVKIEEADEYTEDEEEAEASDESVLSDSDLSLHSENIRDSPAEGTLAYRFKMWSDAYRKFRTSPFLSTPENGQLPEFVRYPPRSTKDVQVVVRDGKPFAKLCGLFEVAVALPVQAPNATNWKELLVGDVVWCKWRAREYWPATVYEITETAPILVTVLWTNDKTQSTVEYSGVDLFDMAFHLRFDRRRSDQKYLRAVTTALRYMGKMGFWEAFLTKKLYEEIVKQAGAAFCLHIDQHDINSILLEKARPHKQTREWKKEDRARRLRSEELLQALQASHFITLYNEPPLVGNAFPLTQQVIEDYLGSARYASRNREPLFEQGAIPSFDEEHVFDINPEVMGTNEIYHPDGDSMSHVCISPLRRLTSVSHTTPRGKERASKKKIYANAIKEEDKPPVMDPISEIDALSRHHPRRPSPKKRPVECFDAKQAKFRRFY